MRYAIAKYFSSFCLSALLFSALLISAARADVYGSVTGTVVDSSDHPVAGASVTLRAADSAPVTSATGSDGRFRFPRVTFDTYAISVSASGYNPAVDTVTVSSGNVVTVHFTLSPKTLGRVVTRSSVVTGQPASVGIISRQTILTLPNNTSLNKVIETVPGIVPFSFNEPVSRGFHGLTYEIDGVPIPQTASSEFAEIIDPRDVDRMEVFTGAMPAEFGGQRQGAVVDVITKRASDITGQSSGSVSLAGGNYGYGNLSLNQTAGAGSFRAFVSANLERTNRGLDSPTASPQHDSSSQGDEFMRLLYSPNARDTFALDFSNQYASFQIPINTNPHDPSDPVFNVPGTDDNQHEYDRFVNLVYNRVSADGNGYFEVSPWVRSGRVTYLPDPANDLAGSAMSSTFQDRRANWLGLTSSFFRGTAKHNFKAGMLADVENFDGRFSIQFIDPNTGMLAPTFFDSVAQRGSNTAVYVQDKYYASVATTINAGLRYDHSTGFTSGNQISPRIEVNFQLDPQNVAHFYYGRLYAAPALEDVRRDAVVLGGSSSVPVYDLKPERDSIYEAGLEHQFSPLARGYVTLWARNVANVLDTTQLGTTPIFTLFNSALGRAIGLELNVTGRTTNGNSYFLSYGASHSEAQGISGGTFLFPVSQLQGATSFAPEDHDQANTLNADYTWNLGGPSGRFVSLQTTYGSGYPVQFENGNGRLPVHWELGAAYGEHPSDSRRFGWELQGTNLLNHQYLIKVNNGFNTTQWAAGRQIILKLTAPLP